MKSSTKEALVAGAVALLFATVLFTQPSLVGGLKGSFKKDTTHCNGKGMINKDSTCNCYSGYRGANCTLRYCPFGKSWATMPEADHVRNRPNVECSDMGICDLHTGLCACRDGFEGRACERSKWSHILRLSYNNVGLKIISLTPAVFLLCSVLSHSSGGKDLQRTWPLPHNAGGEQRLQWIVSVPHIILYTYTHLYIYH